MPVAVSVVLPKSHGAKKQAAATPTKTAELIVITEYRCYTFQNDYRSSPHTPFYSNSQGGQEAQCPTCNEVVTCSG